MASPTTLRGELLKTKRGFNDRLFLVLGEADAGMSPHNPMLLGLGVRLVVTTNQHVGSVKFLLSRVVDDAETLVATRYPTQTSENQWELEGALGGEKLGFPQGVNYYAPQCFKLDLVIKNVSKTIESTYYFWVAEGPTGWVSECSDRITSATAAFACCWTEFDPPEIAPIIQFGLPDPMTSRFSGDPRNQGCGDEFYDNITRDPADGVYDPDEALLDPVRDRVPVADPYTRLPEPSVPAQLWYDELFLNAYGTAYTHVIGDWERWHRERMMQVTPGITTPLPPGVPGTIPPDYADGPSIISVSTPSPNDGLAILDGQPLLWPTQDKVLLGTTIPMYFWPPASYGSTPFDMVVFGGYSAEYTGPGTFGVELSYENAAPGPYNDYQSAVRRDNIFGLVYSWGGGMIWQSDPLGVILNQPGGPGWLMLPINFTLVVPGDVLAVQIIIAPAGSITTGHAGPLWGFRFPVESRMSNVVRVEML